MRREKDENITVIWITEDTLTLSFIPSDKPSRLVSRGCDSNYIMNIFLSKESPFKSLLKIYLYNNNNIYYYYYSVFFFIISFFIIFSL